MKVEVNFKDGTKHVFNNASIENVSKDSISETYSVKGEIEFEGSFEGLESFINCIEFHDQITYYAEMLNATTIKSPYKIEIR